MQLFQMEHARKLRSLSVCIVTVSSLTMVGCADSSNDEDVASSTAAVLPVTTLLVLDVLVPSLVAVSDSGQKCEARLLESDWSYPRSYVKELIPPSVHSFPSCTLIMDRKNPAAGDIGILELRFGEDSSLPDVVDVTWFKRLPESDADVIYVTECASETSKCRVSEDRRSVIVVPPTDAVKAGVWAMWLTPEGVEIGPDAFDAFNTAFWGVSLK